MENSEIELNGVTTGENINSQPTEELAVETNVINPIAQPTLIDDNIKNSEFEKENKEM